MGIIGDIFDVVLRLGWSLFVLFLAVAIGCFVFINLFKLTVWGLILGGITWLIFDSFWIGFGVGIVITVWLIKEDGFSNYMNPPHTKSQYEDCRDAEMPIPYNSGGGGSSGSSGKHYRSTSLIPTYKPDRRGTRMEDLSSELHEMEDNLSEARFSSSEAESARQKFLDYKAQSEEALDRAEMEKRAAEDNKELAERFGDASYRIRMRECYNACDSYMREAQEKANKANFYYERYIQLKSEAEYRRNEAKRLKNNMQNRRFYTN